MEPVALPQNDPNPSSRRDRLADARAAWSYGTWNYGADDQGVKKSVTTFIATPPARELPLIGWFLRVVPGVAAVALNDGVHFVLRKLGLGNWTPAVPTRPMPERPKLKGTPDAPLSDSKGGLLARTERGARLMAFNWLDGQLAKTLGDYGGKTAPSKPPASNGAPAVPPVVPARSPGPAVTIANFFGVYRTLPVPSVVSVWKQPTGGLTDATFAWLRVAGPNPEMLRRVDELPADFPSDLATASGETAREAARNDRLFLIDYSMLAGLQPSSWQGIPRFVGAPRALFAADAAGALAPVAIQCAAGGPVFRPSDPVWPVAKCVVQVADANYHELVAHLGRTHLLVEIFLLATRNELASNHPISRLLVPHFEGTIFINHQARTSLIAPDGAIDRIFAGTIESSQQLAVDSIGSLDIATYGLPARIAAGKTTAIGMYPWRDDALQVWGAIRGFVKHVVERAYPTQADLQSDTELTAWGVRLSKPFGQGGVPGFVAPKTHDELAEILTLIIYTASAQHAAVNFTQFPLMSFAPLYAGSGWISTPTTNAEVEAPLTFFPPTPLALEQADTLYLLSSVHYTQLGRYERGWFGDTTVDGFVTTFQRALATIESSIAKANSTRPAPYTHLLPSLIPQSINI